MLAFIVGHPLLTTLLALALAAVVVPAALWLATRSQQHRPRHRSTERAAVVPGHTPRHARRTRHTHELIGSSA